jgi:WD40 repeat protein
MFLRLITIVVSFTSLLSAMHPIPSLTALCLKTISNNELDSRELPQHYKQLIKESLIRHYGSALWAAAAARDKLQYSRWELCWKDGVALSADNSFIVIAYCDNTAKVWDLKTGKLIHLLAGHTDAITSVAIASDDSYIVTGSYDTKAKLWDTKTGECLFTFSGHNNVVTSVAIIGSQRQIVTGSLDGTAKIWNGYTGKLISTLGHIVPVSSVKMADNDTFIATKSGGTVKIWDVKTSQLMHTFEQDYRMDPVVTRDNEFTVTTAANSRSEIRNIRTGELISSGFKGHEEYVFSITLNKDTSFLVTGLFGIAKVWDAKTGELIHRLDDDASITNSIPNLKTINSIDISSNNQFILTGSADKAIKLWSAKTGKLIKTIAAELPVESVKLITSNHGNFVIGICSYRQVKVWSLGKGELLHTFKDDTHKMLNLAVKSNDDSFIARRFTTNYNTVGVYDTKTKELIHTLYGLKVGHGDDVTAVAISPDNTFIVTGSKDKAAKVWDAKTGNLICTLYPQPVGHCFGTISSLAIDPSNTCINIGLSDRCDNFVYLWTISNFVNSLLDEKAPPEDVLKIINTSTLDSDSKNCVIQ